MVYTHVYRALILIVVYFFCFVKAETDYPRLSVGQSHQCFDSFIEWGFIIQIVSRETWRLLNNHEDVHNSMFHVKH